MIGLVDGKVYSIVISGQDLAGNAGISSAVTGITYDLTPPSIPVLSSPVDGIYTNLTAPALAWIMANDNYSAAVNISYKVEVSLASDFSTLVSSGSISSGTGFTVNPSLTTSAPYYWRVQAIDQAGNVSSFCVARSFTFDNIDPVISPIATNTYVQNISRSFTGFVRNGDNIEVRSVITDNFNTQMTTANVVADLSALG